MPRNAQIAIEMNNPWMVVINIFQNMLSVSFRNIRHPCLMTPIPVTDYFNVLASLKRCRITTANVKYYHFVGLIRFTNGLKLL
jgi:hypothetical protein